MLLLLLASDNDGEATSLRSFGGRSFHSIQSEAAGSDSSEVIEPTCFDKCCLTLIYPCWCPCYAFYSCKSPETKTNYHWNTSRQRYLDTESRCYNMDFSFDIFSCLRFWICEVPCPQCFDPCAITKVSCCDGLVKKIL